MPNLRRTSTDAPIDFAVDDEAAADAGTDGDVEDWRQALAGAEERFGKAGDVGVVTEDGGANESVERPVAIAEAKLKFGAADFNSEVHGEILSIEDWPRADSANRVHHIRHPRFQCAAL